LREAVELRDVRNVIPKDSGNGPNKRRIFFTSAVDGPVRLSIEATGVNAPEALGLAGTDVGIIEGHELIMTVQTGKRYDVHVTLDQPYEGPIEVMAVTQNAPGAAA
jgi:hypothetical protein